LKLDYDESLSNFPCKFNVRRHTKAGVPPFFAVAWQGLSA
jgi:hypothetical protein